MSDRLNSKDPLAEFSDWLKDVKENLKETELHASAHSSPESDPEHPAKVATKSRKHSILNSLHHKTEIAMSASEPKKSRVPCRRRTGKALLRAEKFGDLITADHKVLNEGCEIFT